MKEEREEGELANRQPAETTENWLSTARTSSKLYKPPPTYNEPLRTGKRFGIFYLTGVYPLLLLSAHSATVGQQWRWTIAVPRQPSPAGARLDVGARPPLPVCDEARHLTPPGLGPHRVRL